MRKIKLVDGIKPPKKHSCYICGKYVPPGEDWKIINKNGEYCKEHTGSAIFHAEMQDRMERMTNILKFSKSLSNGV